MVNYGRKFVYITLSQPVKYDGIDHTVGTSLWVRTDVGREWVRDGIATIPMGYESIFNSLGIDGIDDIMSELSMQKSSVSGIQVNTDTWLDERGTYLRYSNNKFDYTKVKFSLGLDIATGATYAASSSSVVIDKLPIIGNEEYIIWLLNTAGTHFLVPTGKFVWYDSTGAFISGHNLVAGYQESSAAKLVAPSTAKYLTINIYSYAGWEFLRSKRPVFGLVRHYRDRLAIQYQDPYLVRMIDPLYGKTLLIQGDSVARGVGNNNKGYGELIAEATGMICFNYAVPGSTMAVRTLTADEIAAGTFSILERTIGQALGSYGAVTMPTMPDEADYILLQGGYNDLFKWTTRGVIAAGWDPAAVGDTFDVTTFNGATERLLYEARKKWPKSKIGFVIGHHLAPNKGNYRISQDEYYFDPLVTLCKKWSIPHVDIRLSGLSAHTTELNNLYFRTIDGETDGDGTHPNELGYKNFYVNQVTEFLRRM